MAAPALFWAPGLSGGLFRKGFARARDACTKARWRNSYRYARTRARCPAKSDPHAGPELRPQRKICVRFLLAGCRWFLAGQRYRFRRPPLPKQDSSQKGRRPAGWPAIKILHHNELRGSFFNRHSERAALAAACINALRFRVPAHHNDGIAARSLRRLCHAAGAYSVTMQRPGAAIVADNSYDLLAPWGIPICPKINSVFGDARSALAIAHRLAPFIGFKPGLTERRLA